MELEFWQFLIICPLVFLAGFVDAIAGGGGLISLPAYLIAGIPPHNAVATNKMSAAFGTFYATYRFARSGYVIWGQALPCAVFALAGSFLGARGALAVDPFLFKVLLMLIIPATAAYILFGGGLKPAKSALSPKATFAVSCLLSFGIGLYDGFYGPGTGTFLLLLLTSVARLDLRHANGNTKVINSMSNLAALILFLTNGKVLLFTGCIAALFGIAGNWAGSRFFSQKGARMVKPVMLGVLAVFLAKVAWEVFSTLLR